MICPLLAQGVARDIVSERRHPEPDRGDPFRGAECIGSRCAWWLAAHESPTGRCGVVPGALFWMSTKRGG